MAERPDDPADGRDPSTRAVHAGEESVEPVTRRPAGTVVWQTAPFVFDSVDELDGAFAAGGRQAVYSRFGNPTVRVAEAKLAALEGAEDAVGFASGLAAISGVVAAHVASGDRIVAAAEIYGGSATQLARLAARHPEVTVETVPLAEIARRLADPERPAPRMVLLETPSNPALECCDLSEVAAAARARGALLVVDNTFATPVLQNPLHLSDGPGADLVVHSATKFLGGHSDATGGFAAGSAERVAPVREVQVYEGACLDPHAAFLLARGMKTVVLRVERQSENAARLAVFLAEHPAVRGVRYPGKDSVARRQMRSGGAMLAFEVADAASAAAVADRLRIFRIIPSLGGVESGVSVPALTSHRSLPPEERRRLGIGDGMLRLSVGIEGFEDLRSDLGAGARGAVGVSDVVRVEGAELHLASPVRESPRWIGREDVLAPLLAAWSRVSDDDLPLNPRLLGKPGVGKTTLAGAAASALGLPLYIQQATMDTRPEDLLVTPVLAPDGGVRYVASPLVSAMLRGGVLVLDEGNRMSEKAWAALAPLLDHRRYVESAVAGVKIYADPEFRFATTMNDDASTYEVPDYIHSRLMPQVWIDFPEEDEERAILRAQVPSAPGEVLEYVLSFLRRAHDADLSYTVRDGINLVRYATKVLARGEMDDAAEAVNEALRLALSPEDLEAADLL